MNIKKLYKAANNEISTNKEKALAEIFRKADIASSVPKKSGAYRFSVTVAASLAAILICYSAVNRFILPADDKNTALKSNLTESLIDEKTQPDDKGYTASEKSENFKASDDTEKTNTVKEDKGKPVLNNEKTVNGQNVRKEKKAEIVSEKSEADTAAENVQTDKAGEEALPFAASVPVKQETEKEKDVSSESFEEKAVPENVDEYDDGAVYEKKSIPSMEASSGGGASQSVKSKNSTAMNRAVDLPLDVTVSCVSISGSVITVNDPIYGTVSADIRNAVILNSDGENAELSDIKSSAELKVTYVSQPLGGKAEICKIIINK